MKTSDSFISNCVSHVLKVSCVFVFFLLVGYDVEQLEIFRFKHKDDYKYEIRLKVFSRILKIKTPRKASLHNFFPEK